MEITASNAIYLGEETGGKGRQFKARFLVPGLVKYDYGVCLLTKENADRFIEGFTGCPVVIDHTNVTDKNAKDVSVGNIFSVWFDEKDGYYWCNGIITDKHAIELINQGYSVSCQYEITEYSDNITGALHNGNPYDKVIENGRPEHLAIVNNPRYEGAIIAVNAINKEQSNIIDQFQNTIYEALAEGIVDRLLAVNEDKWITMKKNGKSWKVKIEEKPENYNANKKLAAWAILSAGTGKKIPWLKMQLKHSEKLQELLNEPDDKLQTSGVVEAFADYYPDLYKISYENDEDSNGSEAAKILERVYDDLLNNNFYDNSNSEADEYGKYLVEQAIRDVKAKIKSDYVKEILNKSKKITEETFDEIVKNIINYPVKEQEKIWNDLEHLETIIDIEM